MFNVNEYFNGKVKSISFTTTEGPATTGVMAVGEYEFGTSKKEIMIITTGKVEVKLTGSDAWKTISAGEKFEVEANAKFGIKIIEESSYVCLYK